MVEHQNREITNRISQDIKEANLDVIPKNIGASIQPVLISNPEKVLNVVEFKGSSGAIYTAPSDKDLYLTNVWVSGSENSSATANYTTVVINGATKIISRVDLDAPVGTAEQSGTASVNNVNLSIPLKVDRGSAITFTLGSTNGSSGIVGYEIDTLEK